MHSPASLSPSASATSRGGSPAPMRAVVQRRYGSPDVLTVAEIPVPEIAADEVLIEVQAAGVDRGVWHLLTGRPYLVRLMGYGVRAPRREVPGLEVSGRVAAVGERVTRFRPGDEVFGIARGAFAAYAAASADKLAHKPPELAHERAAVAPVSGGTALQALTDLGRLRAGQRVLVLGASGGVGTFATQLAVGLGGVVTGVCSTGKVDLVRSLGAQRVLDYRREDLDAEGVRYDLVVDIGGRTSLRRLRRLLTPEGTLVIVGGEGGNRVTGGFGRQLRAVALSPLVRQRLAMLVSREHHTVIERLGRHLRDGQVTPVVDRVVDLEGVPDAIRALEAGDVRGKVAVRIRGAA